MFFMPWSALVKFEFEAGAPISMRWDRRDSDLEAQELAVSMEVG